MISQTLVRARPFVPRARLAFYRAPLVALGALLAGAAGFLTGCYDAKPLRLAIETPATALDCARTADTVFFDAAYVRNNSVSGPDLFYTPRLAPMSTQWWGLVNADLGWGIGVWLKGRSGSGGGCGFELETLSPDPGPGMSQVYSPQRGEDFDRTLREMTRRLAAAFDNARPPG